MSYNLSKKSYADIYATNGSQKSFILIYFRSNGYSILMNLRRFLLITILTFMTIISISAQTEFTACFFDSTRHRRIPVTIYQPEIVTMQMPIILFNHGYGVNKGDSYKEYSCLTKPLAAKGYYVISIQHELAEDPLLAMEGDFLKTRMPNWERGVENIFFTIEVFKKLKPELDWSRLTVMGHSNGGDMSMLFATKYPELINKAISLDNRRMIMPRTKKPRIYTLRGCDYEADVNVIPSTDEQKKYLISVVKLEDIKHGEMDNKGSQDKHEKMLAYLYRFLNE